MPSLSSPPAPAADRSAGQRPPQLDLEIIVPAYNEEERLPATLTELDAHLRGLPLRTSLRVLDNGSSDRTVECVDRLAAQAGSHGPSIRVTGCARRGKGAAVSRGMTTTRARWAGFCDADLATPAAAVDDALRLLRGGWQVVVGSRYCPGGLMTSRQTPLRRIGGAGFRLLTRHLAGPLRDTQCGFKFFDVAAARPVFEAVTTAGFVFDVEVLSRAREQGLRVVEMPVVWSDRAGSSFRPFVHVPQVAADLVRLHRRSCRARTAGD